MPLSRGETFHCCWFLVKTWTVSIPRDSASRRALTIEPAMERWEPNTGDHTRMGTRHSDTRILVPVYRCTGVSLSPRPVSEEQEEAPQQVLVRVVVLRIADLVG